jgi:thiamine biosynthesis lipoprotein
MRNQTAAPSPDSRTRGLLRPCGALAPLLAVLLAAACATGAPEEVGGQSRLFGARRMLMGTLFEIKVAGADEAAARAAIAAAFAEVARVEQPLSEWRESSEISEVNRQAGRRPVPVGSELYSVVESSIRISQLTEGAFDVTFAACAGLWSVREARIPSGDEIAACLSRVDYRRIRLDPGGPTLFLPGEEMRIGIAGIGKGYGVDRAAEVLEAHGFVDYIVDGGGDIRLRGRKPGGSWSVGIRHPRRRDELYATLRADRGAIVTSGDYEQFFEKDGVRYHHILDPSTGRPARGAAAVTVVAQTAMEADALATGLFVLGSDRGLALAEELEGVEALFFGADLVERRTSNFPPIDLRPGAAGPSGAVP